MGLPHFLNKGEWLITFYIKNLFIKLNFRRRKRFAIINLKEKEMKMTEKLFNQKEAAEYLGTTVGTLNSWRHDGKLTIPFVRWGYRVRYKKSDLDKWIEEHTENLTNKIN